MKQFQHIGIGGTFDRLHLGHKRLLDAGFSQALKVTIGLTTTKMHSQKKFSETILTYENRKKELDMYLASQWSGFPYSVIPLETIEGSVVTEKKMDGLVVTDDTKKNGERINNKRCKLGLKKLTLLPVPYVLDENGNARISSGRIRSGEISREGKVFENIFNHAEMRTLPKSLRNDMRKPFGKLIHGDHSDFSKAMNEIYKDIDGKSHISPVMVICVGDIVAKYFNYPSVKPQIRIIDYKTQRKNLPVKKKQSTDFVNSAGTIHLNAVETIRNTIKYVLKKNEQKVLVADGEEDLLALPCILLAPLGSVVLYGLRNEGVVIVWVDEKIKMFIYTLLQRFSSNL